jgi:hypothetical protein
MMIVTTDEIKMHSNSRMVKGWRRSVSSPESHQHSLCGWRGSRHARIVKGTIVHVTEVEEELIDVLHLDSIP